MDESIGVLRKSQLHELMSVFQRRNLASADLTTALKSVNSSGATVAGTSTIANAEGDPARAYLDWNNDVFEIMAAIGVDRDEEAVRAGTRRAETRSAAMKRNDNNKSSSPACLSQPIVDLSLDNKNTVVVVMDLETTGLKHEEHRIIQIAAKVLGDKDLLFNAYVKPVGAEVSPLSVS